MPHEPVQGPPGSSPVAALGRSEEGEYILRLGWAEPGQDGPAGVRLAWRDAAVRAGTTRQETLAAPLCSCACQVFGLVNTPPAPEHFKVFRFFRGGRSSGAEVGRGRGCTLPLARCSRGSRRRCWSWRLPACSPCTSRSPRF